MVTHGLVFPILGRERDTGKELRIEVIQFAAVLPINRAGYDALPWLVSGADRANLCGGGIHPCQLSNSIDAFESSAMRAQKMTESHCGKPLRGPDRDLVEAQRLAREWDAAHPREPLPSYCFANS